MTAWAAAVTGLTPKQTREAYETLESEGTASPEPSRAEVDEFLEQQAFRVRHEPNIPESRREAIVARLRAAIGRITPNRATFHAWKNLVAESWSRVRRRAAAAFLIGAVSFSVGACGNAPHDAATPDAATPVAAAPSNPTTSISAPSGQYDTAYKVAPAKVGDDAINFFGEQEATAGTDAALAFSQKAFWDDKCITTKPGVDLDECGTALGQYMTRSTRANWNKSLKGFIADDKAGKFGTTRGSKDVLSISFYGAMYGNSSDSKGHPAKANPAGPVMVNKKISDIASGVTSDGRLSVTLKSSADMRLLISNKPKLWHLNRSVTFYMKKSGDAWKVDAWRGTWLTGHVRPDTAATTQ